MSDELKLCTRCEHCLPGTLDAVTAYVCTAPNLGVSRVDGKQTPQDCFVCRNYEALCGQAGKWYQEKAK